MTRIVVALDSFKGSLGAAAAVAALAEGWRETDPTVVILARPMADGGEGTLDAFASAVADAERVPVAVRGPHGRAVAASWLLLPAAPVSSGSPGATGRGEVARVGVVELAATSGIELLGGDLRPWDADTVGFGEAIAAALDRGVDRLVVGIGSSASTDGGAGMLTALGARVLDTAGTPVAAGARGLREAASLDLSGLRPLPPGGVTVLSDVTHVLTGPAGAAAVFGPQKGLGPDDVPLVDAALARWADLLRAHPGLSGAGPDLPGAGAAGGTGLALAAWGAHLRPGADDVADLIGLDEALVTADVVVTGEGAFDGQSMAGKVPGRVALRAAAAGVPVALVAGRIDPSADVSAFAATVSLTERAGGARESLADPARWLHEAGRDLARRFAERH